MTFATVCEFVGLCFDTPVDFRIVGVSTIGSAEGYAIFDDIGRESVMGENNADMNDVALDDATEVLDETPVVDDAGVDGAPPAIPPEEGTPDGEDGKPKRGRKTVIIAGVSAVAAIVALTAGGVYAFRAHEAKALEAAKRECSTVYEDAAKSVKAYEAYIASDEAKTALAVTADRVKDAKTVEALAKNAKASLGKPAPCDVASKADADNAKTGNETVKATADTALATVKKNIKSVNDSKAAKALDDAKTALASKTDEARTLLGDSDGKVQDNATRETLTKAIDDAASDKKTVDEANKAKDTLQAAIDQVNASIQAKNEADAAAQAQAQAQAQYTGGGYNYSGGNSSGSGHGYSGNSGGTTGSGTSAPAAPPTGNTNSGGTTADMPSSHALVGLVKQ